MKDQHKHCIALMYHALYANEEEWNALYDEEKPYAVSTDTFDNHLKLLKQWQCPVLDPDVFKTNPVSQWQPGIIITFDDGHKSHYTHALPILKKHGFKAIFFVTTAFTDQDSHFCTWNDLKMMAAEGMDIHAHGHTHDFFADMDATESQSELRQSYELLQQHIKAPWSMSFPGGRFKKRDVELAKHQGFSHIFTSEIGVINSRRFHGQKTLPRFAIKNATTVEGLRHMVMPSDIALQKAKFISLIKKSFKTVLGNRLYHWLYLLKAGRHQ